MHLSWSVLIILCGCRSHSTAAALLHGGSTSGAIIGRRGRVAQLTTLIPGIHSSAALFLSLASRSLGLLSETYPDFLLHAWRTREMALQRLPDTCFVIVTSSARALKQIHEKYLGPITDYCLFLSGLPWGSRLLSPDMSCICTRLCWAWR